MTPGFSESYLRVVDVLLPMVVRGFVGLVAMTLALNGLAARAQSGGAKPTCAAGDTVVWENTKSKVYHLPGDTFYGTTKHGAYACRSAADGAGYHLAGGKSHAMHAGSAMSDASPAPLASATPYGSHHKHHHQMSSAASPVPSPTPT
jgi:hypothetical protein